VGEPSRPGPLWVSWITRIIARPKSNSPCAPFLAPVLPSAGGTLSNASHVARHVRYEPTVPLVRRTLLCDAQTSGGLLIACPPERLPALLAELRARVAGLDEPVPAGMATPPEAGAEGAAATEAPADGSAAAERTQAWRQRVLSCSLREDRALTNLPTSKRLGCTGELLCYNNLLFRLVFFSATPPLPSTSPLRAGVLHWMFSA